MKTVCANCQSPLTKERRLLNEIICENCELEWYLLIEANAEKIRKILENDPHS